MCVAILAPKGKVIGNRQLAAGWYSNSDGGGMAYIDNDGKVRISKGFMEYNPFQKEYERIVKEYGNNGPMLVHMRIRSAGSKNKENTHPFPIKNGALIHNGTMFTPKFDQNTKDMKSDTRIFAETLFNILTKEDVDDAMKDLSDAVGWNKIALLWDGGEYSIINERSGQWNDGIWYSNGSCKVTEYNSNDDGTPRQRNFGFHPNQEVRD